MGQNVSLLKRVWRAALAGIGAGVEHFGTDHEWPRPCAKLDVEPTFLFIVTPPYSGSTALAQILNSCHEACVLQKKAEGQWLVPGMCKKPGSWDPDTEMDWKSIKAVWLKRFELIRQCVQDVEVIIEKSPPNLVRFDKLVETFPHSRAIAYNRDPFANCASILYRRHNPLQKTDEERVEIVKLLASDWLFRAGWIKKWIDEMDLPYTSYEDFCLYPESLVADISRTLPIFNSVNVKKNIQVKNYGLATLTNHNERQVNNLNQREIETIAKQLETQKDLVEFFGYSPYCPTL